MYFTKILLVLCVIYINRINGQERTHYIGAVVDFAPKLNRTLLPIKRIDQNVREYEKFIEEAATKKADIIVFPEDGLTTLHLPGTAKELYPFASVIPDPQSGTYNPCDDVNAGKPQDWSSHLYKLSCAAQKNQIYVVVNLPERWVNNSSRDERTDLVYNTNIAFDRKGNLIARYRKFNLFGEYGFSETSRPELIKFKTDFGVTFGTFICFDIMFREPALELLAENEDVTDIVYPTAWFSELPFLTAVQTQAGWAKANGVNFLSAGYNNPEGRSGGSGIFPVDGNIKYVMPSKHESSMVIHEVPIIKKRKVMAVAQGKAIPVEQNLTGMATSPEKLDNYTTLLINETSISDYRLCHNEFCCVFNVVFKPQETVDYYYRMIVFYGVRNFGIRPHEMQVCGLAACLDKESTASCGKRVAAPKNPSLIFESISIKGDMFLTNGTLFPSYTDYYLHTTYNYFYNTTPLENNLQTIEMKNLEPVQDLLAFGIYGTVFNSTANFTVNLYLILIAFFVAMFKL